MRHEYAFPPERLGSSNASSFAPLYVQLADRISRLIRECGDQVVGKVLPSEAQCAEAFAVSRPTVRQAMDRLLAQGLIKREKGRGTFVARPRLAHDVSHDFDDEMRLAAHRVSYEVLSWGPAEPPSQVVRAFATDDAGELHRLRRLRAVDGKIVGMEERFIPREIADRLVARQLERESVFEIARQVGSEPIAVIEVEVSARPADAESARLMKIGRGSPLLVRASTLRGASGRALIHGTTCFAADHYTFRFTVSFSDVGGQRVARPPRKNPTKRSA